MDSKTSSGILARVKEAREKKADASTDAFAGAVGGMENAQLKSDAFKDVGNLGLTALGVGAGARGLVGLIQLMRANKPKKTRSGPAYLPLPYPAQSNEKMAGLMDSVLKASRSLGGAVGQGARDVKMGLGIGDQAERLHRLRNSVIPNSHRGFEIQAKPPTVPAGGPELGVPGGGGRSIGASPEMAPEAAGLHKELGQLSASEGRGKMLRNGAAIGAAFGMGNATSPLGKQSNFLGGDDASTKGGLPWYGPAMLFGGLAGLGVGWKGMDKVLDARRQREMNSQLDGARQEFHDALLSQYDEPVKVHPNAISGGNKKAASDSTMAHVGQALDTLFEKFASVLQEAEVIADKPAGTKLAFDVPNAAGSATGMYGMYAGLSALMAGSLMYDKINKRSRSAVINKALQRRQRRQFMQRPTEIYAVPEAVPAKTPGVTDLDAE